MPENDKEKRAREAKEKAKETRDKSVFRYKARKEADKVQEKQDKKKKK